MSLKFGKGRICKGNLHILYAVLLCQNYDLEKQYVVFIAKAVICLKTSYSTLQAQRLSMKCYQFEKDTV